MMFLCCCKVEGIQRGQERWFVGINIATRLTRSQPGQQARPLGDRDGPLYLIAARLGISTIGPPPFSMTLGDF
jgi:hypothetical protein